MDNSCLFAEMTKVAKNIAFVTTARSDYSTMYPVMRAAVLDKEISAKIFCGGMHLMPQFGNTCEQLVEDDIPITEKVAFFQSDDSPAALCESVGDGIKAFSNALLKHNVEMIVVSGDRIENLALFSAATCLRIPVCHLCGGDITEGAFDNQVRHTMTKLSHLHMVSMQEHFDRVVQMGEEPWRVTITGDAALDTIVKLAPYDRKELFLHEDIPESDNIVLCTFHPVTLGSENFHHQFDCLLNFLMSCPQTPVITYPNSDPGYDALVAKIRDFSSKRTDTIVKRSFTRRGYYSMLHHCDFMIGNSSSGLWEAPSFKLPCINVGTRQAGRKRSTNVIDVDGVSVEEFLEAKNTMESEPFQKALKSCVNPYGEGSAAEQTLAVIKKTPIDDKLLVKKFYQIDDPITKGKVYG